jgi:hypothetical protein
MATFSGPTYVERTGDELWFIKRTKGVTVVKRQDGSWYQTTTPVDSDLAAAALVYRGGYTYDLSPTEVSELTTAGYGSYITP